MTIGGEGAIGLTPSETTKAKMRAAKIGRPLSLEHRTKIASAARARVLTPDQRARIVAAHLGKKKTPEAIAKTRAANLGMKRTPEQARRCGDAFRGKPWSEARRAAQTAKSTTTAPTGAEPRS